MVVQKASQPITNHCPFADLATNHDGATANSCFAIPFNRTAFPTQKLRHRRSFPQRHQRSVETLTPPMQMIETAVTSQSH
jgi:hypothetical protein